MAVQMRTMLAVADNSGARKLQVILPLGGGLGKKAGLGDIVDRRGQGSIARRNGEEGQSGEGGYSSHPQGARRRDGTYIRFDENAAVVIGRCSRAGGYARLRAGGPRIARKRSS